jgi:hypothetical protein
MALFKDFELQIKIDTVEIEINGQKVNVKQYLPVEKKAGIVNLAVSGTVVDAIVNEIMMDAFLHVFIIEHYTDIDFSDGEFYDVLENFDKMSSNGIINKIIDAIPLEEYEYILSMADSAKNNLNEFNRSYSFAMTNNQETIELMNSLANTQRAVASKTRRKKTVD